MDNRDALKEIAEFLIDKETITGDQFMNILRAVQSRNNDIPENTEETTEENPQTSYSQ